MHCLFFKKKRQRNSNTKKKVKDMSAPSLEGTSVSVRCIHSCSVPYNANCLLPPYPYRRTDGCHGSLPAVTDAVFASSSSTCVNAGAIHKKPVEVPGGQEIEHQKKKNAVEDEKDRTHENEKESHTSSCTSSMYEVAWISGFYTLLPPSAAPPAVVEAMEDAVPEDSTACATATPQRTSSFSSSDSSTPALLEPCTTTGIPAPAVVSYIGGCCGYHHSLSFTRSSPTANASVEEEDGQQRSVARGRCEDVQSVTTSSQWLTPPPPLLPISSSSSYLPSSFPGVFDLLWLPPSIQTRLLPLCLPHGRPTCCGLPSSDNRMEGWKGTTTPIASSALFSSLPRVLAACTDGTVRILSAPPTALSPPEAEGGRKGTLHEDGLWDAASSSTSCAPPDSDFVLVEAPGRFASLSCTPEEETDSSATTPRSPATEGRAAPMMLTSATPFFLSSSSSTSCAKEQFGYVLTTAHQGGCRVHRVGRWPCVSCGGASPVKESHSGDTSSLPPPKNEETMRSGVVATLDGHAFDAWCSAVLTIPCEEEEGHTPMVEGSHRYTIVENVFASPPPIIFSSSAAGTSPLGHAKGEKADGPRGVFSEPTTGGTGMAGSSTRVVTPVLLTGGDDGYLDLYHTYAPCRVPTATACDSTSEREWREETTVASLSSHPPHTRRERRGNQPMMDAVEPMAHLFWHRDRRYTFEAGVVSIAPIRRVGDSSLSSWCAAPSPYPSSDSQPTASFASVYDIPFERMYHPIFHSSASSSTCATLSHPSRGYTSASIVVNSSFSTPYVLVGCYDESVTLLDLRKLPSQPPGGVSTFFTGRCRNVLPGSSSCYIARKCHLGGGAWRVQRTLFPFVVESTAEDVCDGYSCRMTPLFSSSPTPPEWISPTGWVSERNILVLPLMQSGAAMLSYDALAAESAVFGEHVLPLSSPILCGSDRQDAPSCVSTPAAVAEPLVYDTAVLGVAQRPSFTEPCAIQHRHHSFPSESKGYALSILLGTTSFYEKRVDIHEFGPLCASWSINDVLMKMK